MQQPQKTVLILEDRETERKILEETFKDRKFNVLSAGTVEEARTLVDEHGDPPDVLLLDMVLAGQTLGVDFGLEIRERFHGNLPEFLIHSAYDEPAYTQPAFRLGARAYLRKPQTRLREIVRHVRVLALMKALRPEHPERLRRIEEIAESSQSKEDAFASFCEDLLCPELDATLGTPYLLLASQSGSTKVFGKEALACLQLPGDSPVYTQIQSLVQKSPWVVETDHQAIERETPDEREEAREILARLKGTAFIPLGAVDDKNDLQLSLGIVQMGPEHKLVEDAVELAKLLRHFVSPAVMAFLLGLTRKFHEILARQRAVLEATAKICLYVGQEQISLFEKALESEALSHDDLTSDLGRLQMLGENLRRAGELLSAVASPIRGRETSGQASSVAEVVQRAWRELLAEMPHLDSGLLNLKGDCLAAGEPGNLQIAVARLLSWMARRSTEYPGGGERSISVSCSEEQEPRVIFQDNSRRLPRGLRDKLFTPFSALRLEDPESQQGQGEILGPYLAKTLVELEYQGFLEDRTDEIPGDSGHRFVMRLKRPANDDHPVREAVLHG